MSRVPVHPARFAAAALLTLGLLSSCSQSGSGAPDPGSPPAVEDTVRPVLDLSSPQNNSSVNGTLLLQGRVSDNVGLHRLSYRFGNGNEQLLTLPADGTINQSVCLCGLKPGVYTLTVTATDAAGNKTEVTRSLTVNGGTPNPGDTVAPTLTLNTPAAGASVSSPVQVTGTATDNQAVARITYQLDAGTEMDFEVTPGATVNLNTTLPALTPGTHTLIVRAYDAVGNVSTAISRTFIVTTGGGTQPGDTVAPTLTLTSPANGATVTAPVRIAGSASDNVGVTRVSYTVDSGAETNLTITPGQTVNFDAALPTLTAGQHTLTVKAYDAAGNTSAATTRTFTVQAMPQPLVGTGYSVNSGSSELCLLCSVDNAANVVNTDLGDEASMKLTVGALGYTYIRVTAPQQAAGKTVGFVLRRPGSLLDVGALTGLTVVTSLGGQVQETRSGANLLNLALLASGGDLQAISFQTTKAFDRVELRFGGVVGALTELRVRYAFVQ